MTYNTCRKRRKNRRRGVSTLALILGFALIVALLGLAIDIGLLVQRHQQLKTASEAAALAGALEQFANGHSRGEWDGETTSARRQAARYAAANPIGDKHLDLNLNERNDARGDIVFGRCDPPSLGSVFIVPGSHSRVQQVHGGVDKNDDGRINAVLVRSRHSQVGARPVLLMGRMLGLCGPDLAAESIAAVDWRVCGFRPVGCTRVPLLPIVVHCRELHEDQAGSDDEDEGENQDDEDDGHGQHGRGHGRDQYACDPRTGRYEMGADGVPEVLLLISAEDDDRGDGNQGSNNDENDRASRRRSSFPAEIVNFSSHADNDRGDHQDREHSHHEHSAGSDLTDLVLRGLSAAHLTPFAGELRQEAIVPTLNCDAGGQELATLAQALRAIQGQPRLLALGPSQGDRGAGWAQIEDFAACVVVDSHVAGKSLTIRVQPAVLHSCTAITEVGVRPNPGIGKIVLIR